MQTQPSPYGICRTIEWDYEQERPYKGNVLKGKRRSYFHVFYNPEYADRDHLEINDFLTSLYNDLIEGMKKDYCIKDYDKCFEVTTTPKEAMKSQPDYGRLLGEVTKKQKSFTWCLE